MSMPSNNDRGPRREVELSSLPSAVEAAGGGMAANAPGGSVPVVEASWDPYEVWLTRVKQPREQSARRLGATAPHDAPIVTDLSETARLRALSAALPG
jgi:hypothetical protein